MKTLAVVYEKKAWKNQGFEYTTVQLPVQSSANWFTKLT